MLKQPLKRRVVLDLWVKVVVVLERVVCVCETVNVDGVEVQHDK